MFETARNDLTEDEYYQFVSDLQSEGYRKVGKNKSLNPGEFSVTSYSGTKSDFGDEVFYNVRYMPL